MKKQLIYSGMIAAMFFAASELNAQNWLLNGNAGTVGTNYLGTTDAKNLRLATKGVTRMTINTTGNTGLGTTPSTNTRLKIFGATSAADTLAVIDAVVKRTDTKDIIGIQGTSQPNPGYGIGIQGIGNFIGLSGFGGSYGAYLEGFYGALSWGLAADTLYATGEVHGVHGAIDMGHWGVGVFGEATTAAINYGVVGYSPDTSASSVDFAGLFIGDAAFTGKLFDVSDQKFKQNVSNISSGLELISKLRPTTYTFKTSEYPNVGFSSRKQYGFIAQEVESVYPELVKNSFLPARFSKDRDHKKIADEIPFKSVDYISVIPMVVKAVQEQQQLIVAKDAQIADLNARLTALEAKVAGTSSAKLSSVNTIGASLEQNNPNPFNQSTEIRYSVPADYSSAKLIISSVDGKAVRTYTLSGKGQGQVTLNANELAVGSYTYSLNIDGKIIDSKSMVLTK